MIIFANKRFLELFDIRIIDSDYFDAPSVVPKTKGTTACTLCKYIFYCEKIVEEAFKVCYAGPLNKS